MEKYSPKPPALKLSVGIAIDEAPNGRRTEACCTIVRKGEKQ
jgi:hypothetical protein